MSQKQDGSGLLNRKQNTVPKSFTSLGFGDKVVFRGIIEPFPALCVELYVIV